MYKVKQVFGSIYVSKLFNAKNTHCDLRNTDFKLLKFETVRYGRKSIKYLGTLIWSKLPWKLRTAESLKFYLSKRNIRKVNLPGLVKW